MHCEKNPRLGDLGILPALMAAGSAYSALQSKGGGGGTDPGGLPPGGSPYGPPGATTAISPTFQQSFTPQISPVFTQISDSDGATVAATPVQDAGGGQSARGGNAQPVPTVDNMLPIGSGGLPVQPMTSPVFRDDFKRYPTAADELVKLQAAKGFNWTPVIWGVAVIGGLGLIYNIFGKPRRAAPANGSA